MKNLIVLAALALALAAPVAADDLKDMQLRAAINDGRTQEAIGLIEEGVDVNGRTSGGHTPLIIAAGVGDVEVVKLLLARGADPGLRNDSGMTAEDVAKLNRYAEILALLQSGPKPHPGAAPQTKAGTDSHGWPKLGAYPPGSEVLWSGTAGKTWGRGTVASIDPKYGYNLEGWTGSNDAYFVVAPERQPFWTGWFVGDWRVSVPMAMNTVVKNGAVYRTVDGGMRLPPLRVNADGTYAWRWEEKGRETLIRGPWEPNPDGPGVILKRAAYGEDWLVYNNTRTGSSLGHTVILSNENHTHMDGTRL